MNVPLVYVIVLNYNGAGWLNTCLASLRDTTYGNFRVILVDNGSQDDSVHMVRAAFSQVEIIENEVNLGFSEGNNVGIKRALNAGADYVVLLNPDTKVTANWLAEIVEIGENEPLVGILGPLQYDYASNEFNTWTKSAVPPHLIESEQANACPAWLAMDWVEGSCFAVKREIFLRLGYLDPIYFSFYEEIDFCRRAACAGYQIALVPKCRIHHHRGGTWNIQKNRQRDYLCDRGQFIYSMTDPRRTIWGNLKWWLITLGTKMKELLWPPNIDRLVTLVQIQVFLVANGLNVYNKWKRDQVLIA
ncbi:MAG: glycosyltransferase family 2 protein [Acidobacteria bacterium]|nr:glycosyltransferase family 2 protein [Acidobacteriota bacterium]MBI3428057.1 glycosyltransferase family 2 protein [Acidobacteriota bacterium]